MHGVGNDPTYNAASCFETFPFPEGLTLDVPAATYGVEARAHRIAEAAKELDRLRESWINPEEWVDRAPEVVAGYPDQLLPKPGFETVTVYLPGGNCNVTNRPSSSEVVVLAKFVSTFLTSTLAPGTAAPLASRTVPWIVPVVIWDCPHTKLAMDKQKASTIRILRSIFIARLLNLIAADGPAEFGRHVLHTPAPNDEPDYRGRDEKCNRESHGDQA